MREWRAPAWAVRGGLLVLAFAILLVSRRLLPDIGFVPRFFMIGAILIAALWIVEMLMRRARRTRRRR